MSLASPLLDGPSSPRSPRTTRTRKRNNSLSESLSFLKSPIQTLLHLPPNDPTEDKEAEANALGLATVHDESRKRVELRVGGMTCGACVAAIEGQIRQLDGVLSVQVSLLAERAVIEYDPEYVDAKGEHWTDARIAEEVEDVGFDAEVVEKSKIVAVELQVYGLDDRSTVPNVIKEAASQAGVSDVVLDEPFDHLSFLHMPAITNLRAIVDHLTAVFPNLYFLPTSSENDSQLASLRKLRETARWRRTFLTALVFAVPNFIVGMMHMYLPFMGWTKTKLFQGIYLGDLVCLLLTIPVQCFLARGFYRAAFKSLKHGAATMDVLVVFGTTAAFTYSVLSMFFAMFSSDPNYRPKTFFDTSTMLITFVSLGRYIENLAKGKTSVALTDLMALAPSTATIFVDPENYHDGAPTRKIPTELVEVGDMVLVVPGEKIAADGTVVAGSTTVDESMVTGESLAVNKKPKSHVVGGTVNGLGTITFHVTRAGSDTTLAHIVKLVEDAQTSKAPIQQFADRVAGIFVPIVITLSLITFFMWLGISSFKHNLPKAFQNGESKFGVCLKLCISVIVVACPCALGLSTPTAVMVGTGVGAQNGILIKGGRALEACKDVRRVVLDKTGTVTGGKMVVAEACWAPAQVPVTEAGLNSAQTLSLTTAAPPLQRHAVLALIALAESRSEHPLAVAVAAWAREKTADAGLSPPSGDVAEFEGVPGEGIEATVKLHGREERVRLGKASYVLAEKAGEVAATVPPTLKAFEETQTSDANIVIYVSVVRGGEAIPILALSLSDTPKPTSTQAISALRAMGVKVTMLTGDSEATARAIARAVGIDEDEVYAGVSPKGKATIVRELDAQDGGGVAMVGDGINDSPALAAARLGIALNSGTSIAMEAADVVLMRNDLLDVVAALDLGRTIFRKIKTNLIWACCYNILMIPLAMGILLPWGIHLHPMMAAAAMAFSSVSVVCSSLTLKWWRRPLASIPPGEQYEAGGVRRGLAELAAAREAATASTTAWGYRAVAGARRIPLLDKLIDRTPLARVSPPTIIIRDEYEAIPLTAAEDSPRDGPYH